MATTTPGSGLIHARLLPPRSLVFPTLSFVYPLKLISTSPPAAPYLTVFILSYGGGLVSNDKINLSVLLEPHAKLCLLTQGSTKIFKRREDTHSTEQALNITLHPNAALLLLPDPVQPFADSYYTQKQVLDIPADGSASFVLLDWISEGRSARGEKWELGRFESRNEVYSTGVGGRRRLLLRDALILEGDVVGEEALCSRMDGFSCVATLIVGGPLFEGLAGDTLVRYGNEPRIGGKGFVVGWNSGEAEGKRRWAVVWTATKVRGFLLVKVSGGDLEEVRGFLKMLLVEGGMGGKSEDEGEERLGDVVREFGEDALRCLQ